GSDSFTACTAERTIRLEKKVVTCSQVFYIKDKATGEKLVVDTASVDGKTVSRVVTTYYVTIDKDGTYTVKATKAGYERLEESFTEDCPHLLTFYMSPIPKQDTKIVDFSVHDENEKDVTALQVGKEYRLRAYLKTIDDLSIQNATLYFRKEAGMIDITLSAVPSTFTFLPPTSSGISEPAV
ncbi:unnamed protein product, partial [marine sediment metagenome]